MPSGASCGVHTPRIVMFVALFAGAAVPAFSQTVDEIVARNLAARGGVEKLRSIQTVKYTVTMKGFEGSNVYVSRMTAWMKRPNKMRRDTEVMGQTLTEAFDGNTRWERNSVDGLARPDTTPQADLHEDVSPELSFFLDYKEKGYAIELVGTETVNGTPAYHLRLRRKAGPVLQYYVSVETGLDLRMVHIFDRGDGQQGETVSDFSNYQTIDGMAVPHTAKVYAGGELMSEITYEKIEFNVPIEDSVFRLK